MDLKYIKNNIVMVCCKYIVYNKYMCILKGFSVDFKFIVYMWYIRYNLKFEG